jgi:hypothetical protein
VRIFLPAQAQFGGNAGSGPISLILLSGIPQKEPHNRHLPVLWIFLINAFGRSRNAWCSETKHSDGL